MFAFVTRSLKADVCFGDQFSEEWMFVSGGILVEIASIFMYLLDSMSSRISLQ